eukprot:6213782-Pleurochrysis_carterae.AAC.1
MHLWGTCPPLATSTKNAPGSWYEARNEALRRFSIKHYGVKPQSAQERSVDAGSHLPQPASFIRLRPRPDHSNYAE